MATSIVRSIETGRVVGKILNGGGIFLDSEGKEEAIPSSLPLLVSISRGGLIADTIEEVGRGGIGFDAALNDWLISKGMFIAH